jgi:hypothetical protein
MKRFFCMSHCSQSSLRRRSDPHETAHGLDSASRPARKNAQRSTGDSQGNGTAVDRSRQEEDAPPCRDQPEADAQKAPRELKETPPPERT